MKFNHILTIVLFLVFLTGIANAAYERQLELTATGVLVSEDAYIKCLSDIGCDEKMSQSSGYEAAQAACLASTSCAFRMLPAMSKYLESMLDEMNAVMINVGQVMELATDQMREEVAAEEELRNALDALVAPGIAGNVELHEVASKRVEAAISALETIRAQELPEFPEMK